MNEQAKKRWLIAAEVVLAVVIAALIVATWLPAIIGAGPAGGR